MLKHYLSVLKNKLIYYDYCSLTWATRTGLSCLLCLCASIFWPKEAFWFLASATISIQLYAYSKKSLTRLMIYATTLLLTFLSVVAAYFSHWPLVGPLLIIIAIFLSFYFAYKGKKHSAFAMWSMVFFVISVCLPSTKQEVLFQLGAFLFGTTIAYLTTFIRVPKRKKERPIEIVKNSVQKIQQYMTDVFNSILTAEAKKEKRRSYEKASYALMRVRELSDPERHLKFITDAPNFSASVQSFSHIFARLYHLLVSIDRLELAVLPSDIKLKFEYLNVGFQSITYLLHQSLSETYQLDCHSQKNRWNKTYEIIQFALLEIKALIEAKSLSVDHCLKIASFYYLLEKLGSEFEQLSALLVKRGFNQELQQWKQ